MDSEKAKKYATSGEDLWSLSKQNLDVRKEFEKSTEVTPSGKEHSDQFATTVGKIVTEQPMLPSCQVSSGILEFNRGEVSLAYEAKLAEFSLSDLM